MQLSIFLCGVASGFLLGLLFIVMVLRWGWRNKELLRQLIHEIYHEDLLNFARRIEGLLNCALIELPVSTAYMQMYLEKAQEEVRALIRHIKAAVERYTKYQ